MHRRHAAYRHAEHTDPHRLQRDLLGQQDEAGAEPRRRQALGRAHGPLERKLELVAEPMPGDAAAGQRLGGHVTVAAPAADDPAPDIGLAVVVGVGLLEPDGVVSGLANPRGRDLAAPHHPPERVAHDARPLGSPEEEYVRPERRAARGKSA